MNEECEGCGNTTSTTSQVRSNQGTLYSVCPTCRRRIFMMDLSHRTDFHVEHYTPRETRLRTLPSPRTRSLRTLTILFQDDTNS